MKYCSSRFTLKVIEHLLEIPGNISHVQFDPRTRCIDVFFYAEGEEDIAEGQEVVRRLPKDWSRKILEEELNKKWV